MFIPKQQLMMLTGLTGEIANRLSVKKNQDEREMRSEVHEELRTAVSGNRS